jgi:hypothetical protein
MGPTVKQHTLHIFYLLNPKVSEQTTQKGKNTTAVIRWNNI